MIKLDSILGERVSRTSTNELIHICLGCGKPKLYVNESTGCWICFVCGISGRTWLGHNTTAKWLGSGREREEIWWMDHPEHTIDIRYDPESMEAAYKIADQRGIQASVVDGVKGGLHRGALAVPLVPNKVEGVCGMHLYTPAGVFPATYRTVGERGLAISPTTPGRDEVYLFEGLFDWLSAIQNATRVGHRASFVFTVGNNVSARQFDGILSLEPSVVYICYDNDKPGAASALMSRLSLFVPVRLCLPPAFVDGVRVKDWNDVDAVVGGLALFCDLMFGWRKE